MFTSLLVACLCAAAIVAALVLWVVVDTLKEMKAASRQRDAAFDKMAAALAKASAETQVLAVKIAAMSKAG